MKWNERSSLTLSRVLVAFFALTLLVLDALGWWLLPPWIIIPQHVTPVLVLLYTASIPAWGALAGLWLLLGALARGEVFTRENIRRMRFISWCCFGAGALCLPGAVFIEPVVLLAAAACGLMGLIVRIVKNVFEQAALMKDELDLTV